MPSIEKTQLWNSVVQAIIIPQSNPSLALSELQELNIPVIKPRYLIVDSNGSLQETSLYSEEHRQRKALFHGRILKSHNRYQVSRGT